MEAAEGLKNIMEDWQGRENSILMIGVQCLNMKREIDREGEANESRESEDKNFNNDQKSRDRCY